MSAHLLQLVGVSKSFGAVRALREVSFSLGAGEVHALVGENGAGKSTLIKLITGAHVPDGGTIELAGRPISQLNPASARALGIAAIYQQPALFPDLSVAENIALGLERPGLRRVRWSERRRRAAELLDQIGAHIEPDAEVRDLSMPEQQLVEITRSLGAGARVLIMDEPTASLTQPEVELLFGVIRDLREHGVGIIYISHRLPEVFAVADRVTVLRDGETVGTFGAAELDESRLIALMVGRSSSPVVATGGSPVASVAKASPASVPALLLRQVDCRAGGVRDVSLDVHSGEIVGLAGLVGAGRTELARVLFGITPADAGEILVHGEPVRIRSPRQAIELGIAYVPEDRRRHGVILEMSLAANMTMAIHPVLFPGAWLRPGAEREVAGRYMRALAVKAPGPDTIGMALSGGNQQKVSLARWLAARPRVLILDEPTQGVDVGAKAEIHELVRGLAADGLAVLMISSDLPEVLSMSDRVAVMRGGTIRAVLDRGDATAHGVMAAALGRDAT